MKFSDKLANLRKANNLSQEQLADKLNVSRQSVSKWESGDTYPDMAKMIQMCEVLNCTLPDLMDDGTFSEDYSKKDKTNGVSSYLKSFLDYVTKTYNMFIHMTLKSKLVCLIEMAGIGVIIAIIVVLFPDLLNLILDKVFRYVPYGYTISSVLSDIVAVVLAIIGIIVFFHLFKIRYLDYYVTVTDDNVDVQTVEEPIEENKNTEVKQDKTKLIIRDPKHSISHFLDGLGNLLHFILKVFVILISIPAVFVTIGGICLAVIMLANASYSILFTYGFVCLLGVAIVGLILVYMAINFVFKRVQPFNVLIVTFIISLLLIGTGAGLFTNKALDMKVVDDVDVLDVLKDEFVIEEKDITDGMQIYIPVYSQNIEVVIDETTNDIKIEIEHLSNSTIIKGYGSYYDGDLDKQIDEYSFYPTQKFSKIVSDIKNDIKQGYIRSDYDDVYHNLKAKITLSTNTYNKINSACINY